jgi:hypothetical protein
MGNSFRNITDLFSATTLGEIGSGNLMERFELKYPMPVNRIGDFLLSIDGNYRILEIGGLRIFDYKSVYLDTEEHDFYCQHVTGKAVRIKVRYRTYIDTGVTYLEVKKKDNKNHTRKHRIVNEPEDDGLCNCDAIRFLRPQICFNTGRLLPMLEGEYKRITLVAKDLNERVTIDFDMRFAGGFSCINWPLLAIVELKRKKLSDRTPASKVLKSLSVRPAGFSKYCIGSAALYDLPKKNILKEKFLLINRIENEYFRYNA